MPMSIIVYTGTAAGYCRYMNNATNSNPGIISKRVDFSGLEEGDLIRAADGLAVVQSAEAGTVGYRYVDSGDYHERTGITFTLYLEHPAIGMLNG